MCGVVFHEFLHVENAMICSMEPTDLAETNYSRRTSTLAENIFYMSLYFKATWIGECFIFDTTFYWIPSQSFIQSGSTLFFAKLFNFCRKWGGDLNKVKQILCRERSSIRACMWTKHNVSGMRAGDGIHNCHCIFFFQKVTFIQINEHMV